MSKVCELCDKKPSTGHNISHSMRHTKRRFLPNLIFKVIGGQKTKICTRCLRTTSKTRV